MHQKLSIVLLNVNCGREAGLPEAQRKTETGYLVREGDAGA